ncbi:MAG: hypothetical protein QM270_08960 [Bacillota bacterium]|nr:hypothetical protein [Bacillota bacterium]
MKRRAGLDTRKLRDVTPIVAVVVVLLAVLLLTYFALLRYGALNPQLGRYHASLRAGDYEAAGRWFVEEIRGEPQLEREAQDLAVQQLERLKEDFATGRLDAAGLEAAFDRMREAGLLRDSALIERMAAELAVLERSQAAFSEAEGHVAEGELGAAILAYEAVPLLDPRYEIAQVRLGDLRGRYLSQTRRVVREALEAERLDVAALRLETAERLIPGQALIAELEAELDAARIRHRRQATLDACLSDLSRGEYGSALLRLRNARQQEPDEVLYVSEYARYLGLTERHYLERADAAAAMAGPDARTDEKRAALEAARTELRAGLLLVPASPLLETRLVYYETELEYLSPRLAEEEAVTDPFITGDTGELP